MQVTRILPYNVDAEGDVCLVQIYVQVILTKSDITTLSNKYLSTIRIIITLVRVDKKIGKPYLSCTLSR